MAMNTWQEIEQSAGLKGLRIFHGVWFTRRRITAEEEKVLRPVFEKYPLGTDSFKVWLKQRARQEYEKALSEKLKVMIA